jgi:hypothetical protein
MCMEVSSACLSRDARDPLLTQAAPSFIFHLSSQNKKKLTPPNSLFSYLSFCSLEQKSESWFGTRFVK